MHPAFSGLALWLFCADVYIIDNWGGGSLFLDEKRPPVKSLQKMPLVT